MPSTPSRPKPVRFGITFDMRITPPSDKSFVQLYAETLDLIAYADELGIDYVYLSEHHFVEDGHCPSLLPLAGAVAARTKQIRISSYVFLLPLHDPLRIAEDIAVLDIISNGRIELGVGAGYRIEEFEGFGIDRTARRHLMDEGCDVLLRAWTQDNWSFNGRHHRYDNVSIHPKPVQRPHPPLWISARNEVAAARAGRFAMPLMLAPPPYVADEKAVFDSYVTALRAAGYDGDAAALGVAGSFNVIVTDDPEAYRAKVRPGADHRARLYQQWYTEAGDVADDATRIPSRAERRTGVIGPASKCIEQIDDLLAGDVPFTHLIMGIDGAAELEAFAREVLPRYR